jgi:hypothetical protein
MTGNDDNDKLNDDDNVNDDGKPLSNSPEGKGINENEK